MHTDRTGRSGRGARMQFPGASVAMRKKRAMDNEEGRAYKKQRQEEHDELRKQTMEMIEQLPLHSSWYSTTAVRVAITGLEKLATLKKKHQLEDKKIVKDVINQFNGTGSDYKEVEPISSFWKCAILLVFVAQSTPHRCKCCMGFCFGSL